MYNHAMERRCRFFLLVGASRCVRISGPLLVPTAIGSDIKIHYRDALVDFQFDAKHWNR